MVHARLEGLIGSGIPRDAPYFRNEPLARRERKAGEAARRPLVCLLEGLDRPVLRRNVRQLVRIGLGRLLGQHLGRDHQRRIGRARGSAPSPGALRRGAGRGRLGRVAMIPYARPGSPELGALVAAKAGTTPRCCWRTTTRRPRSRASRPRCSPPALEKIAKLLVLGRNLPKRHVTSAQIEESEAAFRLK